jgi:hypothetical protein
VRIGGVALAILVVSAAPAAADNELYDRLWPRVPDGRHLKLSDQITDQLAELGNFMGEHVNALSHDVLAMTFDGRRRRAFLRVGGGDSRFLAFNLASDVHFSDGKAQISARIALTVAGTRMQLDLPAMEMVPASYRGERGVEVRVPLFRRSF